MHRPTGNSEDIPVELIAGRSGVADADAGRKPTASAAAPVAAKRAAEMRTIPEL
jgi:hypothetical protein